MRALLFHHAAQLLGARWQPDWNFFPPFPSLPPAANRRPLESYIVKTLLDRLWLFTTLQGDSSFLSLSLPHGRFLASLLSRCFLLCQSICVFSVGRHRPPRSISSTSPSPSPSSSTTTTTPPPPTSVTATTATTTTTTTPPPTTYVFVSSRLRLVSSGCFALLLPSLLLSRADISVPRTKYEVPEHYIRILFERRDSSCPLLASPKSAARPRVRSFLASTEPFRCLGCRTRRGRASVLAHRRYSCIALFATALHAFRTAVKLGFLSRFEFLPFTSATALSGGLHDTTVFSVVPGLLSCQTRTPPPPRLQSSFRVLAPPDARKWYTAGREASAQD